MRLRNKTSPTPWVGSAAPARVFRVCGRYIWLIAIILAPFAACSAEVTLPRVLASHMVIQRDMPVHVWGEADPGERVKVSFRGHEAAVSADNLGQWSVYLPPESAGGPFNLTIHGKNVITLTDVLVGDVWVASGQSNMEMSLMKTSWSRGVVGYQKVIENAYHPQIRLFHVGHATSSYPLLDVSAGEWTACTPKSVGSFSAAAYFFGIEVEKAEKVPIGLIQSTWGATPAGAWTSLSALSSDSSLMPVFALRARFAKKQAADELQRNILEKQNAEARLAGKPSVWVPHRNPDFRSPAELFNAMIAPLTRLPIRGVIWYQGEANAVLDQTPIYSRLFPALIQDWRRQWGEGNFPFLFVQLANYKGRGDWPSVREAQLNSLSLVNTGMAVAIDIGDPDDIHPRDKMDVGHRLALWARVLSYGEDIEDSGPLFRQAVPEGHAMRVWLDHVAGGLTVRGDALQSFEVAGADGKFVSAGARVDGNTVLVSSPSVINPSYVRYGWSANPRCNLYNGAGLPASPFTSQK